MASQELLDRLDQYRAEIERLNSENEKLQHDIKMRQRDNDELIAYIKKLDDAAERHQWCKDNPKELWDALFEASLNNRPLDELIDEARNRVKDALL